MLGNTNIFVNLSCFLCSFTYYIILFLLCSVHCLNLVRAIALVFPNVEGLVIICKLAIVCSPIVKL